jgi:uncharacterized protein
MIIDAHTHLGRNEHISGTPDQLLKSMDKAGIDKAMVFAGEMNDCPNEWMLEQLAPHKDRLFGVFAVNPQLYKYDGSTFSIYDKDRQVALKHDKEAIQKITDWYGEGKIVACKFYTGYDHYYPNEIMFYLDFLNRVGCPAIFHSGDCLNSVKHAKLKYAHPLHIDEVAVEFPKINFIIAHVGFPWHRDTAEVCYKNDNVYTDISGFVYGEFTREDQTKFDHVLDDFLQIAGSDKLLFGTDWPISDQSSYVDTVNNCIPKDIVSTTFLSQNAQRVFRLR